MLREDDLRKRSAAEWVGLGRVRVECKYWDEACILAGKIEAVEQEEREPFLRG